MPRQRRLDLARLDAEAADLHLLVGAPEEVQHPVRAPARQIAGAVHAAAGRPKRIGHEPLRRQPRAPQVAARQTRARDVKLAHDTGRNGLQTIIQDVGARVRRSDGRWPERPRHVSRHRSLVAHDRRFGGAVGVDACAGRRCDPARSTMRLAAEHAIAGDDQRSSSGRVAGVHRSRPAGTRSRRRRVR